jgi:hypothetical protein
VGPHIAAESEQSMTGDEQLHTLEIILSKAADDLALRVRQVKNTGPDSPIKQQAERVLKAIVTHLDTLQYA